MDQQISINNINLSGKNKVPSGTLRVSKNGFGWKNKLGKSVTVLSNEIQHAYFIKISKKYSLLSLVSSNGNFRFDGFDEEQVANVTSFVAKLLPQINLEKQVRSTKGWNWGDVNIEGATLFFDVDGKVAFDMPLTDVSQSQVDKNDVSIVFNKDINNFEGTQMVEMRFWVPNVNEGEKSTAEELHAKILKNADPHSSSVSGIVTLEQIPIKTPRGKFDIEMFSTSLKLKGNQSSTIPYESITRIASLPTIDEKDCMIILSLDPPLRRGHTNYNHVIIQFPYNDTLEVKLNLTEDQKEKYKGLIEEEMSGKKSDVVKQLFKVITGQKFAKVGSFRSEDDLPAIRCSSKAHEGFLYPMEKNFFFLPTPATFISLSQISHIEFARVTSNNQSNRNFDLVIFMKAIGSSNPTSFIFNNIKKEEFPTLNKYLKEKKLVIRGGVEMAEEEKAKDVKKSQGEENDSEEEDEDFVGDEEDDDDEDEEFEEANQSIEQIDSQDDVTPEKPKSTSNKRKRSASPSPSTSSRKKQKKDEDEDDD